MSFRFFQNCCSDPDLDDLPISELHELLDLVKYLAKCLDTKRQNIFEHFATVGPPTREKWYAQLLGDRKIAAYDVLDFAILLWIMVDVKRSFLPNYGEKENNTWQLDMSLRELLSQTFPQDKAPDTESSCWPYNFHAANLHHMGDFKIIWTERLQDHLVIDETSGTVEMRNYHHAGSWIAYTALISGARSHPSSWRGPCRVWLFCSRSTIVQASVGLIESVDEQRRTKVWHHYCVILRGRQSTHRSTGFLDVTAGNQPPNLNARESNWYEHWGQRLSMAKNIFDQTEPNTLSQWWHDTRNSSRRTTFWIGVLGVILAVTFGFVQSVVGIIQVVRS